MKKLIFVLGLMMAFQTAHANIVCKGVIMRPTTNGKKLVDTPYSLVLNISNLSIDDAFRASIKTVDYGTVTMTETIYRTRNSPIGLRPAAIHHAAVSGNMMGLNFAGFMPFLGHRVNPEYRPEPLTINSYASMYYYNIDLRYGVKDNGRYDSNFRSANLKCE